MPRVQGSIAVEVRNVVVSRTGTGWKATVADEDEVLQAHSLIALDRRVRKRLDGLTVAYQFHTGNDELDTLVQRLKSARATARRYEEKSRLLVHRVILLPTDLSQRDVSVLIGLSHQRVHQLRARCRKSGKQAEGTDSEIAHT
jgi:hypothetical protein